MKIIKTETSLRNYSIFIKNNIIDDASSIIRDHFADAQKIVVLTNKTISNIYGEKIESAKAITDISSGINISFSICIKRITKFLTSYVKRAFLTI